VTRGPLLVTLALSWFVVVNVAVSLVVAGGVGLLRAMQRRRPGACPVDASLALGMRLLPSVTALCLVAVVFVPSFLAFEPLAGPEPVGWVIRSLAGLCVLCLAATGARALIVRCRLMTLVRRWRATAAPIQVEGVGGTGVPFYAVTDPFPVVALVGIWRPEVFIARQVLERLSAEELRAAVAHEMAHRSAHDNAKRVAIAWSPDVLGWLGAGRWLERQWAAAAERAADAGAAAGSDRGRVHLASALMKVARLTSTSSCTRLSLFSTLHECGELAGRISLLMVETQWSGGGRRSLSWAYAVVLGFAVFALLASGSMHALTELCITLLP